MQYGRWSGGLRFGVLLILLAACFLMGGASRPDVLSLIVLQPLAALCALAFVLLPGPINWQSVRAPLLLLAALAGLMAAQLIPLPAPVWTNLPGHAPFAQSAAIAGLSQSWRPMSLTPDLTLAGLIGLIVPLAVLIGFASVEPRRRGALLTAILAGTGISALFGLAQLSGGPQSPFYLYDVTNLENAVGLFSNRNHQALLLAMAWPMLVAWGRAPHGDPRRRMAVRWIAAGSALFLLPLLLVTGSRAGLVLGAVSLGSVVILWWRDRAPDERAQRRYDRFTLTAIVVGGFLVLVATILMSRAEAIQRLLNLKALEDTRVEATPTIIEMARDFFPVGSGFGSFDPLYRYYEPIELLSPQYLNHAHNDLLELVVTAGLPGVVLATLFLLWFTRQALAVWLTRDADHDTVLARAASVMILLTLMSSLVDYPLRTPLVMAVFSVACCWLASRTAAQRVRSNSEGQNGFTPQTSTTSSHSASAARALNRMQLNDTPPPARGNALISSNPGEL